MRLLFVWMKCILYSSELCVLMALGMFMFVKVMSSMMSPLLVCVPCMWCIWCSDNLAIGRFGHGQFGLG